MNAEQKFAKAIRESDKDPFNMEKAKAIQSAYEK